MRNVGLALMDLPGKLTGAALGPPPATLGNVHSGKIRRVEGVTARNASPLLRGRTTQRTPLRRRHLCSKVELAHVWRAPSSNGAVRTVRWSQIQSCPTTNGCPPPGTIKQAPVRRSVLPDPPARLERARAPNSSRAVRCQPRHDATDGPGQRNIALPGAVRVVLYGLGTGTGRGRQRRRPGGRRRDAGQHRGHSPRWRSASCRPRALLRAWKGDQCMRRGATPERSRLLGSARSRGQTLQGGQTAGRPLRRSSRDGSQRGRRHRRVTASLSTAWARVQSSTPRPVVRK
jgi:hypothetical protein